ncbi:MAG TPA: NINE protein [Syntrophomonadaceae bacterium]|nr:NINE protein [Syntrophomonadaceae bacterium]
MNTPNKTKYCSNCGQIIDFNAEICPKCGVRVAPAPVQGLSLGDGKNKIVAAILAIILGSLGAHKFYLGKIGTGILYILFCWTFIPALVGVIEGIIYLTMSDAEFSSKYN